MSGEQGSYAPGDRIWVWRGGRDGKRRSAKVLDATRTLGDTPGLYVNWYDDEGCPHTDYIALTHVEPVAHKGSESTHERP